MPANNQIDFKNIRIEKITLINEGNLLEIFNNKETDSPSPNIEEFSLIEDMFSSVLTGKLIINDNTGLMEQLKLTGWESVFIDVVWRETEGNKVKETPKRYEMGITDASFREDQVEKKASGPSGNKTTAILTLVSDLFTIDNISGFLKEDFMGKISKGNARYLDPEENKLEGFVDKISNIIPTVIEVEKEWKIDGTDNDIWLKKEPDMYPWGKRGTGPRLLELMNYLTEYACDHKNKNAVNFLFWEDLQYVNFRSIESLLREQKKPKKKFIGTFTDADRYAILSLFVISDFNVVKLLYNGALFGEYLRVLPDWQNPYYYFMDTSDKFKRQWISWNYEKESKVKKTANWLKIEKYDPIAEDILEDVSKLKSYNANRMVDSIYGYYNTGSFNTVNSNWWDLWDPSQNGFTGEKNFANNINLSRIGFDKRKMFLDDPSLLKPDRLSNTLWQAQYDLMELPITKLKTIMSDIKWPLTFNRFKYSEAKKTKIKWDIWKQKICCERRVPSTFFAIITDATKIFGPTGPDSGIPCENGGDYFDNASVWAYNWTEVEMWPREEIQALKGSTLMYFYFFDKDNVKNDPSLKYSRGTIENTNHKFPFVFVVPPGGLTGTVTRSRITDSRVNSTVEWTKDTRAFNIRELLNSNFYGKTSEEEFAATMLGTAVSAFGDLSTSDRTTITNYPEHYSMLPVGKFLLAKPQTSNIDFHSPYIKFGKENILSNGELPNSSTDFYFHGALVQMYAIPASNISGMTLSGVIGNVQRIEEAYDSRKNSITKTQINTNERIKYFKNDYLFVFDAPNNHAGICRCNI